MKQLDLRIPADCRAYCAEFKVNGEKATFVTLSSGRQIDFTNMTDDEAVFIANDLYQMEIRAAQNQKRIMLAAGIKEQ